MIERVEECIQKLLAVPYSPVFGLSEELLDYLEKEFFDECFVHVSYDIKKNIYNADEPVKTAFEIDLTTKELFDRADAIRGDEKAFMSWLETQQESVYYVRGDAGTGKSAYLHWLKYHAECEEPEKGYKWEIIDIAESNDNVKILDTPVRIPDFKLIYYKVISAIIKAIEKKIYLEKTLEKVVDHKKTANRFQEIHTTFKKEFDPSYPDYRIRELFCNLPLKSQNGEVKTDKQISEDCGRYLAKSFKQLLHNCKKYEALELFLQVYLYILRCLDNQSKYIIAIDNVERIIGSDEIYNDEITEFASSLRTIQNSIIANNECLHRYYKLIMFMRNTSVRMLTPQQITDIRASTHDMSDWFDVEAIIFNKITWYKKHGEELEDSDEILSILRDNINDDGNLRGLYTKINMIFNNNKRVIVHFLINIFGKKTNQSYIEIYNQLRKHDIDGLSMGLSQFAARSIIYRLLLNEMRQDNFFHAIMTEQNVPSNIQNESKIGKKVRSYGNVGLGYARRILTLAYEHKLDNPNDLYISLKDILCAIFGVKDGKIDYFYRAENSKMREQIAGILFAMNYYDGRNGDWLQFIDIQYYPKEKNNSTRIPNENTMKQILEQNVEKIKVKITTAGIAYLYFIAFSYEYFACKSINSETRKEIIGEYDIPPLLCTIPTKEQIISSKLAEMDCIKTIEVVLIETLKCIIKMNQDEKQGIAVMPFRKENGLPSIKHTERIVNSHRGYLDNYIECLSEIYNKDKEDALFNAHFQLLLETIRDMRNCYKYDADEEINIYKVKIKLLLYKKQKQKQYLN